jgi:hypothetical protein
VKGRMDEWKEGKIGMNGRWGGREEWIKGRYGGKGGRGGMGVRRNGGTLSISSFVPFSDTHGHQFFR